MSLCQRLVFTMWVVHQSNSFLAARLRPEYNWAFLK